MLSKGRFSSVRREEEEEEEAGAAVAAVVVVAAVDEAAVWSVGPTRISVTPPKLLLARLEVATAAAGAAIVTARLIAAGTQVV